MPDFMQFLKGQLSDILPIRTPLVSGISRIAFYSRLCITLLAEGIAESLGEF